MNMTSTAILKSRASNSTALSVAGNSGHLKYRVDHASNTLSRAQTSCQAVRILIPSPRTPLEPDVTSNGAYSHGRAVVRLRQCEGQTHGIHVRDVDVVFRRYPKILGGNQGNREETQGERGVGRR